MSDARRRLPSVSTLLERDAIRALLDDAPRSVVVDAVRTTIDEARRGTLHAESDADWASAVKSAVGRAQRPSLRRVINATGVVLHTNLGRAPLAPAALRAVQDSAAGYSNLEYDIDRGARGSRYSHCVALLRELTGADDALVVNNNAGALVLALNALADGRDVLISRGELVEIGGSFRIPDIMARSGARLVEVGTTNRTHLADYERALTTDTGALMKVHRSNFAMEGFVAEVDGRGLAALGRERKVPFIHDLGSGLLIDLSAIGLTGEPTASQVVHDGASVVTMSGDKLLGGPQAGIIVGTAELVGRLRENPLTRAFRVDKLTLAALEATLALYREPARAMREVPVLAMLSQSAHQLRERANRIRVQLDTKVSVVESEASVGGGAFPAARIPSMALSIARDAQRVEERLRLGEPAIIGRVAEGCLLLDVRTVQEDEEPALVAAVRAALDS